MDSIESTAVKQLILKFPVTEMAARKTTDTNWNESLFVYRIDNGIEKITVPKNIEDFTDNLLMISLLKVFETKRWQPVLSATDLPKAVFTTKEGAFFAGYVSASLSEETGPLNDGTSKYSKGVRAYQTYSVEKAYGKARHLKTGGQAKLTAKLSEMKGFTSTYWGLRGSLVALFKSIKPAKVTDLKTYVLSKNELLKNVKTKLQYENGGCYRPQELEYLASRYQNAKTKLNEFLATLDNPSDTLAEKFDEIYAPVKTIVDRADSEIKANLASRARILFPQDKKKSTIQWTKRPLLEKLTTLDEEKLKVFRPETLPGISPEPVTQLDDETTEELLHRRYASASEDKQALEVIKSWFATFEDDLE